MVTRNGLRGFAEPANTSTRSGEKPAENLCSSVVPNHVTGYVDAITRDP